MWAVSSVALVFLATSAPAADRARLLYRSHCAGCHDPERAGHTPDIRKLRRLSVEEVLESMETGAMKSYGERMTKDQRRAVAEFIAGEKGSTSPVTPSAADNIAGTWTFVARCEDETIKGQIRLSSPEANGSLSGSFAEAGSAPVSIAGTLDDSQIRLVRDPASEQIWSGVVSEGEITGTVSTAGRASCRFRASRE
jgi:cytochrome c553